MCIYEFELPNKQQEDSYYGCQLGGDIADCYDCPYNNSYSNYDGNNYYSMSYPYENLNAAVDYY